jgi:hypothetical protein
MPADASCIMADGRWHQACRSREILLVLNCVAPLSNNTCIDKPPTLQIIWRAKQVMADRPSSANLKGESKADNGNYINIIDGDGNFK